MLHVTYEDISEEERIITDLEILTTQLAGWDGICEVLGTESTPSRLWEK